MQHSLADVFAMLYRRARHLIRAELETAEAASKADLPDSKKFTKLTGKDGSTYRARMVHLEGKDIEQKRENYHANKKREDHKQN